MFSEAMDIAVSLMRFPSRIVTSFTLCLLASSAFFFLFSSSVFMSASFLKNMLLSRLKSTSAFIYVASMSTNRDLVSFTFGRGCQCSILDTKPLLGAGTGIAQAAVYPRPGMPRPVPTGPRARGPLAPLAGIPLPESLGIPRPAGGPRAGGPRTPLESGGTPCSAGSPGAGGPLAPRAPMVSPQPADGNPLAGNPLAGNPRAGNPLAD
jgi:hypothetical protein